MPQLNVVDQVPRGLLNCDARALARLLPGPTLMHLPGRDPRPLFVSVLLHGNETTGFDAVRQTLRRYQDRMLPRAFSVFIGNVAAAAQEVRTLNDQADYNRVWPGTPTPEVAEARVLRQVYDQVAARRPFVSIDLHNNSGPNPYYGCVARLEQAFLHLARLFSRIVVHIERPLGVQSIAMAALCPAVTIECGRIGTTDGLERAAEFIDACLHLSHFPAHPVVAHDIELLRTVAVVKVPPAVSFSFDGSAADIRFRPDLDRLNFSPVPARTPLASIADDCAARLTVLPGSDLGDPAPWFDYSGGAIRLTRPAIPAMLTLDRAAVRADCLCYLMRAINLATGDAPRDASTDSDCAWIQARAAQQPTR